MYCSNFHLFNVFLYFLKSYHIDEILVSDGDYVHEIVNFF